MLHNGISTCLTALLTESCIILDSLNFNLRYKNNTNDTMYDFECYMTYYSGEHELAEL